MPPPYNYDENSVDVLALNYLTCDPKLGWTGRPDFHGSIESPVFRQHVTFNSLGMYDTEHPLEKMPQTFRILLLGDSFVQAFQVEEIATMHKVLENYLNNQDHENSLRFEVLSSGIIGWGTGQQLIYYREKGRYFQPDLVLLAFFIGNDFQNNLPGNTATVKGINCYAPYFAWCGEYLNPNPLIYVPGLSNNLHNNCLAGWRAAIKTMGALYRHSRLYQQLDPFIVARYPPPAFGANYFTPLYTLYAPDDEIEELEYAWQVTLATIGQLQHETMLDDIRFTVAVISPDEMFELKTLPPFVQEKFFQENPYLSQANINRPNQRLTEFFSSQDIPYIDLLEPILEEQMANDLPFYLEGDRHWTVEGNRAVAKILADWLTENELVAKK
ncbi:MAG: SGNH/GDSL hydrolase family protein [Anaerolineae bacterium]|nr:SGNH/GDSL hydrolase family protein [Anaerolineae bacterium]